jgi:hypothetical protein
VSDREAERRNPEAIPKEGSMRGFLIPWTIVSVAAVVAASGCGAGAG